MSPSNIASSFSKGVPNSAQGDAEMELRQTAAGDHFTARHQYDRARWHYAEALRLKPQNDRVLCAIAACDFVLGDRDDAISHLEEAVRVNPKSAVAHESLGQMYLSDGIIERALQASARSVELAPDQMGHLASRAWVLEAAGELEEAWELVQRVVEDGRYLRHVVRLYARLARRRGRHQQALELVFKVMSGGGKPPKEQSSLHLAVAELLEDAGRYDEAFAHAVRGNALRRQQYDPDAHEQMVSRVIAYFTRDRMRFLARATTRSDRPVFVVGMPRSGTSLIEQILASHPEVHGAGELDWMCRIYAGALGMLSATENDYPACLDRLTVDQADGLAQTYLPPMNGLSPSALRITDKFPLNFLHLGLIAVLLPEARIIHCRRDAMDTCLSCFMTHFTFGNDYKYNLTHLGRFYRDYQRLMAHWKNVLDLRILEVDYESVIANAENESRRMVEFLGLPWDERCLRFHETKRSVATASVQQVRRPIYKSSVQRWRRYENRLTPLKRALMGH